MKTLHLTIMMTLSLSLILLVTTQHAFADTCSAKLTSYNAPQFYLLSDEVFVGTVQHIDNATDHQWKVYFTVDKIWRGTVGQKPLIVMTNDLQGCGYSIVQGEKYLVYTNGYPPFFNTVWSKPYADAQGDIAIIDDPKFQSDEKAQEDLNKKLVIARDAISNLMGSKMGTIPFNSVGVDVINSTLDIGIDSAKAVLSEEEYEKKIKDIVGDIPIKITFGQIFTAAPTVDTLAAANSVPISLPPLQQFKSGIKAENVKCNPRSVLIIKWEDGSPACVKPDAKIQLLKIGWAVPGPKDFGYNPGRGPLAFHDPQSNGMNYHGLPTSPNIRILYNGTQSSRDAPFYVKQGRNVTLMVDVTSDPVNIPVSLYAEPHIGFTKTNGIDLELSDNMVNTPAKIILYMSISKDATPNTYQTLVKANTTGMGLDSHFFVKVIK